MKRVVVATLLLLLIQTGFVFAQEKKIKPVKINGFLVEDITYKPVLGATYEVMNSDSVKLSDGKVVPGDIGGRSCAWLSFMIDKPGKYIIKCEKEGYETTYNDYVINKIGRHQHEINLDFQFFIKRIPKSKRLNQVTVKATKVKFYVRGDTLVYNADAFELAEGSMLDALINQLPDVEMKPGGEIYVRGRKVDELLLNGRDFFNGDRQIILENLPSYMVSDVKVYEREDSIRKRMDPMYLSTLSMDVRLKKQYSIGLIANAEAGMGTKDKRLARLFALRFTPHSRLSFFANMNNLNDNRKPGNNGDWNPLQQAVGEKTTYNGGLDYNVDDKKGAYRLNGSLTADYSESNTESVANRENFLTGGNTFGKSYRNQNGYNANVSTKHWFVYNKKIRLKALEIWYASLAPKFDYSKNNNNSVLGEATLYDDANKILGDEWKEKLMSLNSSEELEEYALNRLLQREKSKGHKLNTGTDWCLFFNHSKNSLLGLNLSGSVDYLNSQNKKFDHYKLDYFRPAGVDFRNRYNFNETEAFSYDLNVQHPQILVLKKPSIGIDLPYYFRFRRQETNRSLYLLNKLDAWGIDTQHGLGELPSINEMLLALDNGNSYEQCSSEFYHSIGLKIQHGTSGTDDFKRTRVQWTFRPKLVIRHDKFSYFKPTVIDTTMSRTNVFFEPSFDISVSAVNGKFWANPYFDFSYGLIHDTPQMVYLTGVTDDSNPLNIMNGNKNLKNTAKHVADMTYFLPLSRKRSLKMNSEIEVYVDKVALGYIYDRATGVRTITPDNVNGNWKVYYGVTYSSRLNKKETLSFSNVTTVVYNNSVDLIGTSATADRSVRSRVGTTGLNDAFLMSYRPSGKMDFSLKANVHYQNASSGREDFETINICDFDYGATARIELPLNFQFSTDLTMYSRRGYSDPSMNTNELVWNARVAKRFMHGNLVCMLDAFDLFGNLSNVRRVINAQGRVETWNNVTPQYALLHIIYRLNKQPKKK